MLGKFFFQFTNFHPSLNNNIFINMDYYKLKESCIHCIRLRKKRVEYELLKNIMHLVG